MATILVVYASSWGQTRKVADAIAKQLRGRGHDVEVADAFERRPPPPDGFDGVVIGSRVQMSRHAKPIIKYITRHRDQLTTRVTAFFSVNMAAFDVEAGDDPEGYLAATVAATGWRPRHLVAFAGGLPYRRYGWFLRLIMKRINARHHGAETTDTTRDHEFTNWDAVREFADRIATDVEAQGVSPVRGPVARAVEANAETKEPSVLRGWFERHSAIAYFMLAFAISWGGILGLIGPTHVLASPEVFDKLAWVGPLVLGPVIAGVVMTGVAGGRQGLRDYRARLFRWRVGARWLLFALLIAPVYMTVTAFALAAFEPSFLPAFVTADDKASLWGTGIAVALAAGVLEEAGWSGFATPTLRRRHGSLMTGVIIGLLWSLWHVLPEVMGARKLGYVELLPLQLVGVFINLTGFRIIMVWLFDRTRQSLVVGILLHTGLTASLMISQPLLSGPPLVGFGYASGAVVWAIIGIAAMVGRWQLRHRPLRRSSMRDSIAPQWIKPTGDATLRGTERWPWSAN